MSFTYRLYFVLIIGIIKIVSSFSQIINIDKIDTNGYVKKATWNGNVSLGLEVDKQKH
ncbi:MAG: hypothetical protein ABUL44_03445 [Flavobacterium sp.]